MVSSRQLKRMVSVNQSPIFNQLMETIQGLATIRTFYKKDLFIDDMHKRIDRLQSMYYASMVCDRYVLFVSDCCTGDFINSMVSLLSQDLAGRGPFCQLRSP